MALPLPIGDPSSVTSYNDLIAIAPQYLDGRGGDVSLYPHFIRLVEAQINRKLAIMPVSPMHKVFSFTLSTEYAQAPDLVMKPLSLEITRDGLTTQVDYVAPEGLSDEKEIEAWWRERYQSFDWDVTNRPCYYTIINNQMRFFPVPTESWPAAFTYFERLSPVTVTNQANWMLRDHGDVYFYGLLAQAFAFVPDNAASDKWGGLFVSTLDEVLGAYPKPTSKRKPMTDMPRTGETHCYRV